MTRMVEEAVVPELEFLSTDAQIAARFDEARKWLDHGGSFDAIFEKIQFQTYRSLQTTWKRWKRLGVDPERRNCSSRR